MKQMKHSWVLPVLPLLIIAVYAVFFMVFVSCSRSPDMPGKVIMEYLGEKAPEKQKEYLTAESLRMLSKIGRQSRVEQPLALVTGHHSPDAEFVILEEETRDNQSKIRLQCVEHPIENSRGFTVSYILVRESGNWKVDLSTELEPMLSK